jgi:hypothetical protein
MQIKVDRICESVWWSKINANRNALSTDDKKSPPQIIAWKIMYLSAVLISITATVIPNYPSSHKT